MGKFNASDLYKVLNEEKLFKKSLDKIRDGLPSDLYYASSSKWTEVLKEFYRQLDNYLSDNEVGDNQKNVELEYFNIDAGIWEEEMNSEIDTSLNYLDLKKSKRNIWNFEVAIEHENDFADWLYELKQLLCFNVPLKVLISYNNKSFCNQEEFVTHLTEILNAYSKYHEPKIGEEFVFLFGKTSKAAASDISKKGRCHMIDCNTENCAFNGLIQYKYITYTARFDSLGKVIYSLSQSVKVLNLEGDETTQNYLI